MVSIPVDGQNRKRIPANALTSVEALFFWCTEVLHDLHPKVARLERAGDSFVTRCVQYENFTDDDGDDAIISRVFLKLNSNYRTSGLPPYASVKELVEGTTVPSAYLSQ